MPLHDTPASSPETTPQANQSPEQPTTRRSLREARERRINSVPVDLSATHHTELRAPATDPAVAAEISPDPLPVVSSEAHSFVPPQTFIPPQTMSAPISAGRTRSQKRSEGSVLGAKAPRSTLRRVAKASVRSSGGRQSLRATLVVALVVPGIFGTVALPAFSLPDTTTSANSQLTRGEEQSIAVSADAATSTLDRDTYSASSAKEIASAAAATGFATANSDTLAAYQTPSAQGWWRPLPGPITSPYGPRALICNGAGCSSSFHEGMDFGNDCGTPIRAANAGTVTFVGNAGAFGNRVIIDHGGGIETIYGHILTGSFKVAVGDVVAGGTEVAEVGATGVVSGCHLDLKVNIDGAKTDPKPFLISRGVPV